MVEICNVVMLNTAGNFRDRESEFRLLPNMNLTPALPA